MKLSSFRELFIYLLSDIYAVENIIVAALPRVINAVESEELKKALQQHFAETKDQVKRLEECFYLLGDRPVVTAGAQEIRNLFIEAHKLGEDNPPSPLMDATIIAIAQHVEHYEIAKYGTLAEFADCVDNTEVKKLMGESLKEEVRADEALTKIAKGGWFKSGINEEATHNLLAK